MGKGTKAAVAYFNGAATGKVGHAQAGGKSGGSGEDATQLSGHGALPSTQQPKGSAAGGTENTAADGKSLRANTSGPGTFSTDNRPSEVKVSDGLSVPERIKR